MGQKRMAPPPGLLGAGFAISQRPTGEYFGIMNVWLPGMEQQAYRWSADPGCPEELAAFYDDVTHTLRTETRILSMAVEELTRVQRPLF